MTSIPPPPLLPEAYEPDYIIIGGGTAGCVLANRLSEKSKVLMIETGPPDFGNPDITLLERYHALTDPMGEYTFAHTYNAEGGVVVTRAKILGGCSTHNNAISLRIFKQDLERWKEAGVTGWDLNTFNRCLDKLKVNLNPGSAPPQIELANNFITSAAAALSIPIHDDFNSKIKADGGLDPCAGRLNFAYTDEFHRSSASVAYIHPLLEKRENLSIMYHSRVTHFDLTADKSINKVYIISPHTNKVQAIKAKKEVILCAGVIDTPRLMLLSGIGPANELKRLGIPVVHTLAGVGENLQDRVSVPVVWQLKTVPPPRGPVAPGSAIFINRDGITPVPKAPDLLIFGVQPPTNDYISFSDLMTEATYRDLCDYGPEEAKPPSTFVGLVTNGQPLSRGKLVLTSKNPFTKPSLDLGFLRDPGNKDAAGLVNGILKAREVAKKSPFKEKIEAELLPGPTVTTNKGLLDYVYKNRNTGFNLVGTAKMGAKTDATAVVDSNLKVIGIKNLRIADASVFPTALISTPYLAVMAVAERCAELIIEDHAGDVEHYEVRA